MEGEFYAAIAGAIVGSVGSGVITWLVQLHAMRGERSERKLDRLEAISIREKDSEEQNKLRTAIEDDRRGFLARSLLFKLTRIYSSLKLFHDSFEATFGKPQARDGSEAQKEAWHLVKPFAGIPVPINFLTEEMVLALSLGNDKLFNSLMSIDQIHNSTLNVIETYGSSRMRLVGNIEEMQKNMNVDPDRAKNQRHLVDEESAALNAMVMDLRERVAKDYAESAAALDDLAKTLASKLGLNLNLKFK